MSTLATHLPDQIAFKGGQLLMTQGIAALVKTGALNPTELLQRHFLGDDGDDLCAEDHATNLEARQHGWRILSSYKTPAGKVWIITEADRSVTTILLPDEY